MSFLQQYICYSKPTLQEKKQLMEKTFIPKETNLRFIKILKTLISDYYQLVIEREKEICSFGIFTDSDISGFVFYYNTKSKIKPDTDKWWMPEWIADSIHDESFYHQDDRRSKLEKIMEELIGKSNWDFDDAKNTFAIYKSEMFDSLCEALKELKDENLFKEITKDFFLLVQESDNGIYDSHEISLKKIMSNEQFEDYRKHKEE